MLQANDITNLFQQFSGTMFHRVISRIFLDNMTIWDVIQNVSGYHWKIYRKFLDNTLNRVIIRKISVFYPLEVDYPEKFGIINS